MSEKNKALTSLLFYVTFCSLSAKANFFSGLNENITSIKNKEPITVDVAFGIGVQNNGLIINEGETLRTTNSSLYILGANINNKTKLSAVVPAKDRVQSQEIGVDSTVASLAVSFDFTDHLKASLAKTKNKGFYLESSNDRRMYRLPDLEFNMTSATFYWLYNPKHQSIYLDPYVYDKGEDSSSWISLIGINQTELKHLDQTKQLSTVDNNFETPDSAEVQSLAFRQLYSRNWFWTRWYVTGALGYGVNFDRAKQNFGFASRDVTSSSANTVASLSVGYLAKSWGLSMFTNVTQATYQIENIDLNSNIGIAGLYFTYQF